MNKIIKNIGTILGIASSVFLLTFVVLSWTGPQHTPPTCESGEVGCDEVLHTGITAQAKTGGLLLNTGGAETGLVVEYGNVGIGIVSPTQKLDVNGTVSATSFVGDGSQLTGVVGVPAGAILMFDTSCPVGWTRFSALDSKFPQGSATYGATGGSSTHTHTYSGTSSYQGATGNTNGGCQAGWTCTTPAHSHTYSGTTGATSTLPPYLNVVWCKKD